MDKMANKMKVDAGTRKRNVRTPRSVTARNLNPQVKVTKNDKIFVKVEEYVWEMGQREWRHLLPMDSYSILTRKHKTNVA